MDAACLPALAVIGAAALPLPLAEQYARLERGELDELAALSVRAQLRAMAGALMLPLGLPVDVDQATPSVLA